MYSYDLVNAVSDDSISDLEFEKMLVIAADTLIGELYLILSHVLESKNL